MDPRSGGPGSPYGFPFSPSAFGAMHPQMALDPRSMYARYGWDAGRMMEMAAQGNNPMLADNPFVRSAEAAFLMNPACRLNPFWEQMYRLQAATSLRGMPLDPRVPLSPDYLLTHQPTAPPTAQDIFGTGGAPSMGLPFHSEGMGLTAPRPVPLSRIGRKRPLSTSSYGGDLDLAAMMRMSPTSMISGGGSRCSSSASGTFGNFAAGALSPSMMGMDPTRFAQLQQLMMQQQAQLLFPTARYPSRLKMDSNDDEPETTSRSKHEKREAGSSHPVVSSSVNPPEHSPKKRMEKLKGNVAEHSPGEHEDDEDIPYHSPQPGAEDAVVETRCRWENCDLEFQTNTALVLHVNQDHLPTDKKHFICRWTDCCREGKPFKALYMLNVHMRRHTGEKPHRCDFGDCQKAYSRLENLKTHSRSHTGERPYPCEFPGCMKAFTNASDRAKHQNRTHSNLKPYNCKVPGCSKRYTDPSSLRKHVKTVHGPEHFASKKHKGNDVPRRGRDDSEGGAGGHRQNEESRSSKSNGGSEPSTPRGPIKQESMEMSPSYSHPSSVFTNASLDSPLGNDFYIRDQTIAPHFRNNDPIAEVENEDDFSEPDIARQVREAMYGPEVAIMSPRPVQSLHGRLSVKPVPPPVPVRPQYTQPEAGPVNVQDLSQRFNEMNTVLEPRSPYYRETMDGRRDSAVSVGTYYSSVHSDMANNSRRVSETSFCGMPQGSPPYDPISVGNSRRSSEPGLVPTRSVYQQKMQMRTAATSQRWQPTPQPQQTFQQTMQFHIQPVLPQNGRYNGARRSSEPVGLGFNGHPQRGHPLTRRNIERHNSVCTPLEHPFNEPIQEDPAFEERENLLIPDDMVKYLNQVAEAARLEREQGEDSDEDDSLPVIPQHYPPEMEDMGNFTQEPTPTPLFHPRSASFSYEQHMPSSSVQRRASQPANFFHPGYRQTQRRCAMAPGLNNFGTSGLQRPMSEGSPDSYEVSSTTAVDQRNLAQRQQMQGNRGMRRSSMIGAHSQMNNDVNLVLSPFDENQFAKMIQS